jgi:hypothetical protein
MDERNELRATLTECTHAERWRGCCRVAAHCGVVAGVCGLSSLDHPQTPKRRIDKHEGVAGERVWEDGISGWVITAGVMREGYHLCLWGRAALAPRGGGGGGGGGRGG